jgi:signal transduction histidine kinase
MALGIVGVVLVLFLLRNPLLYRNAFVRLAAAQSVLGTESPSADQFPLTAQAFDVRALRFSGNGRLLRDTVAGQAAIPLPSNLLGLRSSGSVRDASGKMWLYSVTRLPDGSWLLVATPRPKVIAALALLTDELLVPIIEGGVIALLLSLVLAYVLSRWMADPLERIVAAARTMPSDNTPPVAERGPEEVQALARAFNAMVARVRTSRIAQRDFVANVSHELKTPLTSIQGFAQALMDGTVDSPEQRRQAAEVIYNEAGRMHRMALDLLELARLDAGTAEFKKAPVDMLALLRSVCDKFQPMALRSDVELHLAAPQSLPALMGDGDRLSQVFSNMVDNALKFTPTGGSVRIRAMQEAGELQVAVNDTGAGIPAAALPHIFDRFYQADAARSGGDHHGAGLGLAIAHEVVAAHGGRISVRSAEGRGTGFVVHLPLNKIP